MVKKKTKKGPGTALAKWEQKLADDAAAAADQEKNTGNGSFFSIRAGTLSLNDSPLPGNTMAVVIIDSVLENVFYAEDYDPDNPASPDCFSHGRDEDAMVPGEESAEKQSPNCGDCKWNEWGSSDKGKGKACRNRRRLALIPAGTIDKNGDFEIEDDPEHYANAEVSYLALPPTSIKNFGSYVKKLAASLKRPPHGVITQISVVPDPKTQIKVAFEMIDCVPNDQMQAVMDRNGTERELTAFPYVGRSDDNADKKPKRGKAGKKTKKKAARRGSGRARKY